MNGPFPQIIGRGFPGVKFLIALTVFFAISGGLPALGNDGDGGGIADVERQLERYPEDSSLRWELIWQYQNAGLPAKARPHLEYILQHGLGNDLLWDQYFALLEGLKETDAAVQSISAGRASFPAFADEFDARMALRKGRTEEAEKALRRLLEADPARDDLRQVLANCLIQQKRYAAAREELERLMLASPRDFTLVKDLARVALMENNLDIARTVLRRYVDGHRPSAVRNVVEFLFNAGQYDLARKFLDEGTASLAISSFEALSYTLKISLLQERYGDYISSLLGVADVRAPAWRFVDKQIQEVASCDACLAAVGERLSKLTARTTPLLIVDTLMRYYQNRLPESVAAFERLLQHDRVPPDVVSEFVETLRNDGETALALRVMEAYDHRDGAVRYQAESVRALSMERVEILSTIGKPAEAVRLVDSMLEECAYARSDMYPMEELSLRTLRAGLLVRSPALVSETEEEVTRIRTLLDSAATRSVWEESLRSFPAAFGLWEGYAKILSRTGAFDYGLEEQFAQLLNRRWSSGWLQSNLDELTARFKGTSLEGSFQTFVTGVYRNSSRRGTDDTLEILTGILQRYRETLVASMTMLVVDSRILQNDLTAAGRLLSGISGQSSRVAAYRDYRLAAIGLMQSQPEKAVDVLREFILRYPDSPDATSALLLLDLTKRFGMDHPAELSKLVTAWYRWVHGNPAKALQEVERLTGTSQESPIQADALVFRALISLESGDRAGALNAIERFEKTFPASPQRGFVRLLQGVVKRSGGSFDASAFLKDFPGDLQQSSWYHWARALHEGRPREIPLR